MRAIGELAECRRGATAVEYGLIMALVVIAMLASLELFAGTTINMYNHVQSEVSNASTGVT